jgi:hypothetical protein
LLSPTRLAAAVMNSPLVGVSREEEVEEREVEERDSKGESRVEKSGKVVSKGEGGSRRGREQRREGIKERECTKRSE